jgi:hypothetical protein
MLTDTGSARVAHPKLKQDIGSGGLQHIDRRSGERGSKACRNLHGQRRPWSLAVELEVLGPDLRGFGTPYLHSSHYTSGRGYLLKPLCPAAAHASILCVADYQRTRPEVIATKP